jgi:hypothetical protein
MYTKTDKTERATSFGILLQGRAFQNHNFRHKYTAYVYLLFVDFLEIAIQLL